MQNLKYVLACALLATSIAHADPTPPAGTGSGAAPTAPAPPPTTPPTPTPPTPPAPTPPAPTDGTTTTTTTNADGTTTTTTTVAPPTPPAPEPTPPPAPPAPTAPPAPVPAAAPEPTPAKPDGPSLWARTVGNHRCKRSSEQYYSCERGFGIFHQLNLAVGALSHTANVTTTDAMGGTSTMPSDVTAGEIVFEGAFLGVPSSFAPTNFHGIDFSMGMRSSRFDFWMQFGTAVTFLNLGSGGPGTLRLGGGFGAGFNLGHGYGYLRGRAAAVILPEKLDVEASVQWTPPSASTSDKDEQIWRLTGWYRWSEKSAKALEVYIQMVKRVDTDMTIAHDREIIDGLGGGVGISFM